MVRLRFNQEEKVWDEIPEGEEKTDRDIVFSRLWKNLLDRAKLDIANDLDVPVLFCGEVGSGKSTFAKLSCRYMSDEEFNPRLHMVRKTSDIKTAMRSATKGTGAVLFDEASKLAAATRTMEKGVKYFHEVLDLCRQRNLFIALCAPHFHRLGSQLAVDRTKVMVRTYIDSRTGCKGRYAFYGSKKKEALYRFAKKNHGSLRLPKPKYRGTFGNDLLNQDLYIKMKDETFEDTLDSLDKKKEKAIRPQDIIQDYKVNLVRSNMDMPVQELADILKVSRRTLIRLRNTVKDTLSQENQLLQNEKSLNSVLSASQT